jgi:hypothetical protein
MNGLNPISTAVVMLVPLLGVDGHQGGRGLPEIIAVAAVEALRSVTCFACFSLAHEREGQVSRKFTMCCGRCQSGVCNCDRASTGAAAGTCTIESVPDGEREAHLLHSGAARK